MEYQKKLEIVFQDDYNFGLKHISVTFEEMPKYSIKFEIRDGFNNIVFSDKYSKKLIKKNAVNNSVTLLTNCLLSPKFSPYYIYVESKKEFKASDIKVCGEDVD